MNIQTATAAASAEVRTRSDLEAEALKRYREETLALLTPSWMKFFIAGGLLGGQILFTFLFFVIGGSPLLLPALAILPLGILIWIILRINRRNREIHIRAELTPVFDMGNLRGQVLVVDAAWKFLQSAAQAAQNNPERLSQAVQTMFGALKPLLDRGPTTIENATVAGYKPYPGIETMSMPGDDADFISFHLLRIDASLARLASIANTEHVLSETISQVAGEFVPPLRALEAQAGNVNTA